MSPKSNHETKPSGKPKPDSKSKTTNKPKPETAKKPQPNDKPSVDFKQLPLPTSNIKEALSGFWQVVKAVGGFQKWVLLTAAGSSLIDLITNVGPPFPDRAAVCFMSALAEIIVYVLYYDSPQTSDAGEAREIFDRADSRMKRVGYRIAISGFIYILLYSALVLHLPDRNNTDARGWLSPIGVEFMESKGYGSDLRSAVEACKNKDPKVICIPWTVDISRIVLLVSWLALYCYIAALFSAFVSREVARSRIKAIEAMGVSEVS